MAVPLETPSPLPEKPRLRSGCQLALQEFREGPSWVLENPSTGKFFRLGLREEQLVRRLTGQTSALELLAEAKNSEQGLTPDEVLLFLQNLKSYGLLDDVSDKKAPAPPRPFNPMFLKMRLGNPDRLFGALEKMLRPIPGWAFFVVWALLVSAAGFILAEQWLRFTGTLSNVFSTSNIPAFMVTFVGLKILHESAHGVVCKRFGGHVPEVGLLFVFFLPLTYVDATATWRLTSPWKRIAVSSAGMLVEFAVAALAVFVWANTDPGALNTIAANAVIAASLTTVLFNANPLMKFDGYFILSDLTGRPNLYQQATRAGGQWLASSLISYPQEEKLPTSWWITFYGLCCIAWRTALIWGLSLAAIILLHGIGVILAVLTISATYWPMLKRSPKIFSSWSDRKIRLSWLRLTLAVALLALGALIPVASPPAAAALIEPASAHRLRVQCPGFLREILVQPGEGVEAGQIIFRLENLSEGHRLRTLQIDAQRALARANQAREAGEHSLMAQHLEQANALQQQSEQAELYLATLELRAPQQGLLYARRFDHLIDTYLTTGRELVLIGDPTAREARIAVSQKYLDRLSLLPGDSVEFLLAGQTKPVHGEILQVESAATTELRYPELSALAGGPLAVVSSDQDYRLSEPHLFLTARLESSQSLVGARALARFPKVKRQTTFSWLGEQAQAFIERAGDMAREREAGQ
ncbi:MAG: site-2 protease family protein [Verrucomicrobiales bacterium]